MFIKIISILFIYLFINITSPNEDFFPDVFINYIYFGHNITMKYTEIFEESFIDTDNYKYNRYIIDCRLSNYSYPSFEVLSNVTKVVQIGDTHDGQIECLAKLYIDEVKISEIGIEFKYLQNKVVCQQYKDIVSIKIDEPYGLFDYAELNLSCDNGFNEVSTIYQGEPEYQFYGIKQYNCIANALGCFWKKNNETQICNTFPPGVCIDVDSNEKAFSCDKESFSCTAQNHTEIIIDFDYASIINLMKEKKINDEINLEMDFSFPTRNYSLRPNASTILRKEVVPGRNYKFNIWCYIYLGITKFNTGDNSIECNSRPFPPQNLSQHSLTSTSLWLSWREPKPHSEYEYYTIYNDNILLKNISKNQIFYEGYNTKLDVEPCHIYNLEIRTLSGKNESILNPSVLIKTPPNPPKSISTWEENNILSVQWKSGANEFILEIRDHSDKSILQNITLFESKFKSNKLPLSKSQHYDISIKAICNGIGSQWANLTTIIHKEKAKQILQKDQLNEELSNETFNKPIDDDSENIKTNIILSVIIIISIICAFLGIFFWYYRRKKENAKSFQFDEFEILIEKEKLKFIRDLGQGQFGMVMLAKLKTKYGNKDVAVKMSHNVKNMNDQEKVNALQEATLMSNFNHGNVIKLIGVCFDENGSPLVVMPLMGNGSLLAFIRNDENGINREMILNFGMDVAKGMVYLSSLNFIHRDLAARNCLIDDNMNVVISDFGLTKQLIDKEYYKETNASMPYRWMAIESLEKQDFTLKSDVWSYGVLVWELMSKGGQPYSNLDNAFLIPLFLKSGQRLSQPYDSDRDIYELCLKCWEREPKERPNFTEIIGIINNIKEKTMETVV